MTSLVRAARRWQGASAVALSLAALATASCGSGNQDATGAAAGGGEEARLTRTVLDAADIGDGYTQEVARAQTNDQAARARPDSAAAMQQYEDWRQVLAYNVQYAAPAGGSALFSPTLVRVTNTATLFGNAEGASSALAYVRSLSPALIADILTHEGAGTQISDTQVVRDLPFPPHGDQSFAWRVSGKATFDGGFTTTFIADTIFVRVGAITGSITGVALGDAPDRAELERLAGRFVEKARDE